MLLVVDEDVKVAFETEPPIAAVPEPESILELLAFGSVGVIVGKKKLKAS